MILILKPLLISEESKFKDVYSDFCLSNDEITKNSMRKRIAAEKI